MPRQVQGLAMVTIRGNFMPFEQLAFIEVWDAWSVPLEQQKKWVDQYFPADIFRTFGRQDGKLRTLHSNNETL